MILAVTGNHVEGIELRPLVVHSRAQRAEVLNAVLVEHDHLAVDHEVILAQLERGRDDLREVSRPVMAARLIKRTRFCSRTSIMR